MGEDASSRESRPLGDLFKDPALYSDPEAARRALADDLVNRFDDIVANAVQTAFAIRKAATARKNGTKGGRKREWPHELHQSIEKELKNWCAGGQSRAEFFSQFVRDIELEYKAHREKPPFAPTLTGRRDHARKLERRQDRWRERQAIEPGA